MQIWSRYPVGKGQLWRWCPQSPVTPQLLSIFGLVANNLLPASPFPASSLTSAFPKWRESRDSFYNHETSAKTALLRKDTLRPWLFGLPSPQEQADYHEFQLQHRQLPSDFPGLPVYASGRRIWKLTTHASIGIKATECILLKQVASCRAILRSQKSCDGFWRHVLTTCFDKVILASRSRSKDSKALFLKINQVFASSRTPQFLAPMPPGSKSMRRVSPAWQPSGTVISRSSPLTSHQRSQTLRDGKM